MMANKQYDQELDLLNKKKLPNHLTQNLLNVGNLF